MAKKKTIQTTRDTDFNYFRDPNNTKIISSLVSVKATKDYKNIRLLGVNDGISATGYKIITHAAENTVMDDLGSTGLRIDVNKGVSSENQIKSDTKLVIYGAPFQVVLNNRQHFNNCGVESTLNNLAMAGIIKMSENLKDQQSVEKQFLKKVWERNLCQDDIVIGVLGQEDGGTLPDDYKDILALYGIKSHAYFFSEKCDGNQYDDINQLAYKISRGHGAVVGVCAEKLWSETVKQGKEQINHAIAITGVVYKEGTSPATYDDSGNLIAYNKPVGFYIHDTGAWMTRYISLEEFIDVTLYNYHGYKEGDEGYDADLYPPERFLKSLRNHGKDLEDVISKGIGIAVTFTDEPIKTNMFNINATGDKQDNIIWGNSGDNIIKGMSGNDTLYGNSGHDEIYGGNGDDIIVGNSIHSFDKFLFKDYITDENIKSKIDSIEIISDIEYSEGLDTLYGDAGNDIIMGGDYADLIYGGKGNDYIYGGDGRNAIYGGAGNDLILGGYDNDRLFGEAGNDYIYGFMDDDTINGGAGHDHIWGGRGDDSIETGKGNDTIYIEGDSFGRDTISSQGGNTTIKFIDEEITGLEEPYSKGMNIAEMKIKLSKDSDNKNLYNLSMTKNTDNDDEDTGVEFRSLYNSKTNKTKSLTLTDIEDDVEHTYKVSASKSSKIKASANTGNLIFSLRDKGAMITTSKYNDIVNMVETGDKYNLYYKDPDVYDSVTYTGGNDIYVSEERDTHYYVNEFSDSTNLTIRDNVKALEKVTVDKNLNPIIDKNVVSKDDRLYLNSEKSNLHFLFDVELDGTSAITTKNNGLFLLNNNDNFSEVIKSIKDADCGCVYMESFFGYDKDNKTVFDKDKLNFFGNGQIEKLYYKQDDSNPSVEYERFNSDLAAIAGEVAKWLSSDANTKDYTSAFEAFSKASDDGVDITALVNAYNLPA